MSKWIEKGKKVVEKFRNKKILALYLLGVLLLSGGVSYAFFTSRTESSGSGSVATGTTIELIPEGLYADGNIGFNHTDIYPGHKAIASIRVIGTGAGEAALYDVVFNGTNTFTTPLNYTVYKTTTNIDVSYSCNQLTETSNGGIIYYEECIGSNIDSLGEAIGTGTINHGTTILKSDEILITSEEGEEVYYYVVIEYPNLDSNQNDDMGSTISGNITIDQGEYQKPNIVFTASTTAGSNGWVQSASITSNITTQTGVYEAQYCTTTSSNCTPNTTPNISDNAFQVTLSDNRRAQKVCVRVTDEYNQITEQCSNAYQVDGASPTSNVTLASSTSGSNGWYQAVSITASGSDSHSRVESIKYCTTTSTTCTPSTSLDGTTTTISLSSNASAQRLCAQAVDTAGNTSTTTCSSTYNVDATNPTVSITSTSSTEDTIRVTVRGSDNHSGIYQYRFSSNGGSSYTTVSSTSSTYTYTFNNLNSGTTYNIRVQSVDRSGRVSSTASRSVATESPSVVEVILANSTRGSGTPNFANTSCSSGCEEATVGLYEAKTSKGTTYYFRGDVDDNWVSFAGYYWRIIRINEDGTIRLIYNGASTIQTGTTTQIGTSQFNSVYGNNMYVGYMYTSDQVHGLGTDSTIKGVLDTWYEDNLQTNYSQYLSMEAGFCGDREPSTSTPISNGLGGTGRTITRYGAFLRLYSVDASAVIPTFECQNDSDLYTVTSSNQGNKSLDYPIGLITADEVAYAGGVYGINNTNYYLYTAQSYWTMSPRYFGGTYAFVFDVSSTGVLNTGINVSNINGVRPVINLRANVQLSGSGTSSNPYVVS